MTLRLPLIIPCLAGAIVSASGLSAETLNLTEAVRQALQNNFDIRIESINPEIASDQLSIARGAFEPSFFSSVLYENSERKQNVLDFVSSGANPDLLIWDEENLRLESGIGGKTPWGLEYKFSTNLDIIDNSTNRRAPTFSESVYSEVNGADAPDGFNFDSYGPLYTPEYESFVGVTLSQPLLRGSGPEVVQAEANIAKIEVSASELERQITITNKLVEVVNAFYDLSFGAENLRVKHEAIELAEQFHQEAQRKFEVGRASEIDVARAEVKVSEAREEAILAEDFRRDRQIALMQLIVPGWNGSSVYADYQVEVVFDQVSPPEDLPRVTAGALNQRPDLRLAEMRRDQEDVREVYSRSRLLPSLDLQFRYGLNGYGGDVEDTYDAIGEASEPAMAVGLTFSMPLGGNRIGKSEARLAKRRREQASLNIHKTRTEISLQVLNASRRIETFVQRLETAVKSRELAEKALAAEQKRFENGLSSSFDVLDLQTQLSDARTRELAAQVDLKKSEAELWSVSGELLPQLGVSLENVASVR